MATTTLVQMSNPASYRPESGEIPTDPGVRGIGVQGEKRNVPQTAIRAATLALATPTPPRTALRCVHEVTGVRRGAPVQTLAPRGKDTIAARDIIDTTTMTTTTTMTMTMTMTMTTIVDRRRCMTPVSRA